MRSEVWKHSFCALAHPCSCASEPKQSLRSGWRGGEGGVGRGRGRGKDEGLSAGGLCRKRRSWRGLDVLATLHFWLILSGLHLDGHHVVAG